MAERALHAVLLQLRGSTGEIGARRGLGTGRVRGGDLGAGLRGLVLGGGFYGFFQVGGYAGFGNVAADAGLGGVAG
jgi:hypothetical protein